MESQQGRWGKGPGQWPRAVRWSLAAVLVLSGVILVLGVIVWLITFHPENQQAEQVMCGDGAPLLPPDVPLKVMTWNVQYMAGKNHVFFYDLRDGSGPDERPTPGEIAQTLHEVARVIADEDPDVVLLQEVDDGSSRSDGADQLAELLRLLSPSYRCHASAFYWKAAFVPHPRILGSVGMKVSVLSKYRVGRAVRHQLPLMPNDPLTRQFNFKRAVLEVALPRTDGSELVVLSTHLDAFAQGTDTMQKQVEEVRKLLRELTQQGKPWVIGGDFNLLPPGDAFDRLPIGEQGYFNSQTELAPLFREYASVPSLDEANGPDFAAWYTHFPNGGPNGGPDRTIDFLFFSPLLKAGAHAVRQRDTLTISDHLPVVAVFEQVRR